MKIIDSIRALLTNKAEVSKHKTRNIESNILYMNRHFDSIFEAAELEVSSLVKSDTFDTKAYIIQTAVEKNRSVLNHSSFLWILKIEDDSYDMFRQISECLNLCEYKVYPFIKRTYVIISLSCMSIHHILKYCRFINNPIIEKLREEVYMNSFPCFFQDLIKDGILDESKFVRTEEFEVDDDFEQSDIPLEKEGIRAKNIKIINYDDLENIKANIAENYPELSIYVTNNDLYDLLKITVNITISIKSSLFFDTIQHKGLTRLNQSDFLNALTFIDPSDLFKELMVSVPYDFDKPRDFIINGKEMSMDTVTLGRTILSLARQLFEAGLNMNNSLFYSPLGSKTIIVFTINYRQLFMLVNSLDAIIKRYPEIGIMLIDLKYLLKDKCDFENLDTKLKPIFKETVSDTLEESIEDSEIDETIGEPVMERFGIVDTAAIPQDRIIQKEGEDKNEEKKDVHSDQEG